MTSSSNEHRTISEKVQKIIQDGCLQLKKQFEEEQDGGEQSMVTIYPSKRAQQIRAVLKAHILTDYKNNNSAEVSLIFGEFNHSLHSHLLSPKLKWDSKNEEWKLPFGSNFKRPNLVFYSSPSVPSGEAEFLIVDITQD